MTRSLVAFCLAVAAAVAQSHPVSIVWAPAELDQLRSPHGALLIPVEFGTLRCLMQLDTAAVDTVFYEGTMPRDVFQQQDDGSVTVQDMTIGGVKIQRTRFPLFKGRLFDGRPKPCTPSTPDVLVGTIGITTFESSSIAIDMVAGTFELIAQSGSPSHPEGSSTLQFASLSGVSSAIPIFKVKGKDGRYYTLLLDTGSAPIGALFYREAAWSAETTDPSRSQPFKIVRWGHGATCRLGRGTLDIVGRPGGVNVTDRLAYCDMEGDSIANGNEMDGLIGLSLIHI